MIHKRPILFVLPCTLIPTDNGTKTRVSSLINVLERDGHGVFIASIDLVHGLPRLMRKRYGNRFTFIPFYGRPFVHRSLRALFRFFESSTHLGALFRKVRLSIRAKGRTPEPYRNFSYFYNDRVNAALNAIAEEIHPGDVVFLRHYLYKYARGLRLCARKIVLTEDRLSEQQAGWDCAIPSPTCVESKEEGDSLNAFDLAVSIQEKESCWFRSISTTPVVTIGPLLSSCVRTMQRSPGPPHILFIGSLHNSNINGIRSFITHIWPLLRKLVPEITMTLGGTICNAVRPPHGIKTVPFVISLNGFYSEGRVTVSPIWDGTGVKIKSVEALAHGVPVVTSTIATQGLEDAVGNCVFVGDTPTAFAEQVARLVTDDQAWWNASNAAKLYCNSIVSHNSRAWLSIFEDAKHYNRSEEPRLGTVLPAGKVVTGKPAKVIDDTHP